MGCVISLHFFSFLENFSSLKNPPIFVVVVVVAHKMLKLDGHKFNIFMFTVKVVMVTSLECVQQRRADGGGGHFDFTF